MQVIIEAFSFEHAEYCLGKKCPHLIVGNDAFASRLSYSFSQEEINNLNIRKKETKLWVKVNAFFFEQDIAKLTAYLEWLATIGIDYVIFQDYAIAEIKTELNLNLKLHYNPESLVTSYGQFDFFKANKFTGCFLSRELTMNEIQTISQHKNELLLEVQGFGFGLIMHSRWNLINNFQDFYHAQIGMSPESVWIKEKLRKIPNLIFEDNHGTHMLSGYVINALEEFKTLSDLGVDLYLINFLKMDSELATALTALFLSAMSDLNNNQYQLANYQEALAKIVDKRFKLSAGFLGNIKDLPHLEKETEHE